MAQQWTDKEMRGALEKSMNYFRLHEYDKNMAGKEDLEAINGIANMIRLQSRKFADEYMSSSHCEESTEEEEEEEEMECEGHVLGDEKDWTPEMAEFVRQTREHRRRRKCCLFCSFIFLSSCRSQRNEDK